MNQLQQLCLTADPIQIGSFDVVDAHLAAVDDLVFLVLLDVHGRSVALVLTRPSVAVVRKAFECSGF